MPNASISYAAKVAAPQASHEGRRTLGASPIISKGARRCRAKFLRYYPRGFADPDYLELERAYKWNAHERWSAKLSRETFKRLIAAEKFGEIAAHAIAIEARTNLLFSFEKMALRDALKSPAGARAFATGLYSFLHGTRPPRQRFDEWCEVVGNLPRRGTRVLTWPVVTVMSFLAQPKEHIYLKPMVTRRAAAAYGFDFRYASRPNWDTYNSLLTFARTVRRDVRVMRPRDMIDIQSFIWVQGSEEYPA